MAHRGRLIVNPTLQLTALADVSTRGMGRRRVEITDARALALLLAAVTGGRRPRLDGRLARRLVRHGKPFLPAGDVLWVRQAGNGIELPYVLTPARARALRHAGRRTPAADVLRVLGAAGDHAHDRVAWRRRVQACRRELRTRGYAVLRDLFPGVFMAAVHEYYRRVEREGYLLRGEAGRHGRPLVDDEPLLVFLGAQLARVVREVTRERVPSTFSFLRIYDAGATLARHRDHPACRWNIDLVVGGDPVPKRASAWPLWFAARTGRRAARLGLGDGVLYRGTQLSHWRAAQPAGRSTMLACFHYGRGSSRA